MDASKGFEVMAWTGRRSVEQTAAGAREVVEGDGSDSGWVMATAMLQGNLGSPQSERHADGMTVNRSRWHAVAVADERGVVWSGCEVEDTDGK